MTEQASHGHTVDTVDLEGKLCKDANGIHERIGQPKVLETSCETPKFCQQFSEDSKTSHRTQLGIWPKKLGVLMLLLAVAILVCAILSTRSNVATFSLKDTHVVAAKFSSEEAHRVVAKFSSKDTHVNATFSSKDAHVNATLLQKPAGQSIKTIFVNSLYGTPEFIMQTCPVQCKITTQKSKVAKADAAVFNPRWMAPFTEVPSSKPRGQKWVFNFFFEAPIYRGKRVAGVVTERLSKMTDWTLTFNHASDFWSPMAKMVALTAKDRKQLSNTTLNGTKNFAAGRKYLLVWFVSSCDRGRMQLFEQLARKLPRNKVHMYGACGEPLPCPGHNESDACYQALFAKYKFYASFVNARCADYITEKFFRPLTEGMVPLVLGGNSTKDYERLAPRGSFVDVSRFSSLNALARYLRKVDRDDVKYNTFFGWRSGFRIADPHEVMDGAYCELCQNLHRTSPLQKPVRSFRNLSTWWYSKSCRSDAPSWDDLHSARPLL